MSRTIKDFVVIGLKGMAMGAADVVPGVSGGTIAFISGIYEELLTSISNVNLSLLKTLKSNGIKAAWKQLNGSFLFSLFVGIFISIVSLAKVIKWMLENEPILLWSFFFGLVLASIIYIAKQLTTWNVFTFILLILGAGLAYYITRLNPLVTESSSSLFLFLAGALAICAMILPGISGAFILVLLGAYKPILAAVNNRDFTTIAFVGAGAIIGLLTFSRVLKWLFTKFKNYTLAVLTGFIIGSLNKIWPWKLTQSVFDKVTGTIIPFSSVSDVGSLSIYEKKMNDFETYKVALEKSVSPFHYSEANQLIDNQLFYAIVMAIVGFGLILLLEKLAVQKN
jgi:putative membrane protein